MNKAALAIQTLGLCTFCFACSSTVSSGTGHAGSGGGPAGSTIASTGANPKTTSSESTGTGPDPSDPMLCQKFCTAAGNCYPDCQATCNAYLAAPCKSEGALFVSCLTGNFNQMTCTYNGTICGGDLDDWAACVAKTPQNCMGDHLVLQPTYCEDVAECAAGEERVICDTDTKSNMQFCTCYRNAMPFRICNGPAQPAGTPGQFSLATGCCAQYFGT